MVLPDSGRESPTWIAFLLAVAHGCAVQNQRRADAILGSGQLFESEGAGAPVVRSTGQLVFAGAAYC